MGFYCVYVGFSRCFRSVWGQTVVVLFSVGLFCHGAEKQPAC